VIRVFHSILLRCGDTLPALPAGTMGTFNLLASENALFSDYCCGRIIFDHFALVPHNHGRIHMRLGRRSKFPLLLVFFLTADAAMAQPPGRGEGNRVGGDSPNDPAYLLESESVQAELALTDEQKANLQKIRDDANSNPNAFRGFMRMTPEQIEKRLQQRANAERKRIAKVLSPEQMQRLDEINIQAAGVTALGYVDVAKMLKLTAEQKTELKKLSEETSDKLANLYSPTNGQPAGNLTPQQLTEKRDEIRSERANRALAILTDEQKAAFEKLQGEKFDTSTIKPRNRNFTSRGRIGPPPGFVPQRAPRPGA
jgi:Spy/CpxP family protein refolding chaperone